MKKKFKHGYGKHAENPRTQLLNVRVTSQEYQSIKNAMEVQGCRTVSEWIRRKASMGGDIGQFRIERVFDIPFQIFKIAPGGECQQVAFHRVYFHIRRKKTHLNRNGQVADSKIKETIEKWINEKWHEHFIVYEKDFFAIEMTKKIPKVLILSEPPTSENLVLFLLNSVCPKLLHGTGVEVTKIILSDCDNHLTQASIYE